MKNFFKKVASFYAGSQSIRRTAEQFGISICKCRKILITEGVLHYEYTDQIAELAAAGMSAKEIGESLGFSSSKVNCYMPYMKGEYNADEPSENALAIRACRNRKPSKTSA